jgi:hypothetical protein
MANDIHTLETSSMSLLQSGLAYELSILQVLKHVSRFLPLMILHPCQEDQVEGWDLGGLGNIAKY